MWRNFFFLALFLFFFVSLLFFCRDCLTFVQSPATAWMPERDFFLMLRTLKISFFLPRVVFLCFFLLISGRWGIPVLSLAHLKTPSPPYKAPIVVAFFFPFFLLP